ncbi:DUF262 domain-containing protein [Planctomonas psychrotolerans]|uniref:DUF262 domain-containing protein n=1 Tax=Planctomonas psychrotolerans TaxID=2528712 RepID=UPI001D0D3BAF|nr:DUF262 domain-containing protein [Planctomonas psychrotolerans]
MSIVKLTNNTHETDIGSLIGRDAIFVIPFFQRPYKWMPKRLVQFEKDLLALVDGTNDVHFLGAVIHHGLYTDPSDPDAYQVIDGQQRLTTIYLYLCAVVQMYIELGETVEAQKIFRKYIASGGYHNKSNIKLQSSKEDQGDMNAVIREVLATRNFDKSLEGFKLSPLPSSVESNQRVATNYKAAKSFLRKQVRVEGAARLGQIYARLVQSMTIVQIDIKDPTNGPKIFDSLNSGQEPMTTGDLVRNDVFAKTAADDPDEAVRVDTHYWGPFYQKFKVDKKEYFDDYFFPFGLIYDSNLRKSDVYAALKSHWVGKKPEDVVEELSVYQAPFLDLKFGTNSSNHPKSIRKAFRRFYGMGAPSSIYPFLMNLSVGISRGDVNESDALETMRVLDSFLVRRALCGHEPTGLHAVFKGLWGEVDGKPSGANVSARIATRKTVQWPSSYEVRESVKTLPLYGTSIDRYVLMQYEESLGGDDVSSLTMWIEHVLPQASSKNWSKFSASEHARQKDLFANLIPLSSQMNGQLQTSAYSVKAPKFESMSAFTSARTFAKKYPDWTPAEVDSRSTELADWCIERWPHEAPQNAV